MLVVAQKPGFISRNPVFDAASIVEGKHFLPDAVTDANAPDYTYDVFISYSTQDRAWVRGELLQTLEQAGLKTCIDYRDFHVGAPSVTEIKRLIKVSARVLVVLTPNYVQSNWTQLETLLLTTQDPANQTLRLLPILRERCDISEEIGILTYVDFTDPDDLDFAWTRLLTALGRPPQPPPAPETSPRWFLAHPYPMPPNFTGRAAELDALTHWLGQGGQPVYMLRAMGGFGKSALTWHWLTHRVEAQRWPQVVWWSFYEESASFDNFLRATLAYLTGRNPGSLPPRQQLRALLDYLQQHPVLIVMDGFERELRAYGGLGAAYQGDEPSPPAPLSEGEGSQVPLLPGEQGLGDGGRDCLSPLVEEFLRGVACQPGLRGRVLMSTRLRPRSVELHGGTLLAGCAETELTALAPADAVAFFRSQGMAGNRGEMVQVCGNYGFHPLSLRLLAGYIAQDFDHPNDIRAAARLDVSGDLVQRRNHVLAQAYDSLPPAGKLLLGRLACFRSPVAYEVLESLEQSQSAEQQLDRGFWQQITSLWIKTPERPVAIAQTLDATLRDLINRGLVQQETRQTPQGSQARFDLHPIVRRYAYDRMTTAARTAAHGQLRDYFATVPAPERVKTLDDLTPAIELYHHMVRAGQYDEAQVLFRDRINKATYYQLGAYQLRIELLRALFPQGEGQPPQLRNERTQGWTLNELANSYSLSGQPRAAVPLFEQHNMIYDRLGDQKNLAVGLGNLAHQQLAIGALQSAEANLRRRIDLCQAIADEFKEAIGHNELGRPLAYRGAWAEAEGELATALDLFEKGNAIQGQVIIWAYRSLAGLLRGRAGDAAGAATALAAAVRSLELAKAWEVEVGRPNARDYVRAHWLLGAAHRANGDLSASDTHLTDALTRCRTINMVDHEADILLDLARLRADQGQPAEALSLATEALTIANRCGYALQGADIHLFLAQHHRFQGDPAQARPHAQAAHRLATCDGGDHIYRVALDEATALLAQLTPA